MRYVSGAFTGLVLAVVFTAATSTAAAESGVEVQTRGPIHEAFAQPSDVAPSPGPEVPKQPPAPIRELPPDQKPAGQNVQWIPGYWQWDADRNDFLWVSGVYRDVPPGRQWVAGYWTRAADGNGQYVAGYWGASQQPQAQYVPQPPATLENGPSLPAPDDNSIYTPGTWMNRDSSWAWRPGFYLPARAGRVWTGPRYAWTPAGNVFVDGYWDYPLEDRGLLFAPVYFNQPLWQNPNWCYQPSYVVNCDSLFDAFWFGPRRHHYYFGNYFGPNYARLGFSPWNVYGRRFHDPLFTYYGWRNRGNPGWFAGLGRIRGGRAVVTPLSQFRGPGRLTAVTARQLAIHRTQIQGFRQASVARLARETAFGRSAAVGAARFHAAPAARALSPVHNNARPVIHNQVATNRGVAVAHYRAAPAAHVHAAEAHHAAAASHQHAAPAHHAAAASHQHAAAAHHGAAASHQHAAAAHHAAAGGHGGHGGGHGGGHHK
jgi:WXXGXW repeat (2 copies)